MENMIKEFLRCSIRNEFVGFDFQAFFDDFKLILHEKLTAHGLTTFEDYADLIEGYGVFSDSDLEMFTLKTDYVYYGEEDVKNAILKGQYEAVKKAFENTFEDLEDLYKKLDNGISLDALPLKDKIILFDECIHAEHCNGDILDNLDQSIEDIKEEIDKEYADGLLL